MIYHKGRWLIAPEIKALLDKLEDMNEELRSEADRVLRENTVLREKQESADRQIAEYDDELRKAKKLLRAAVEDIRHCMHYYDPCEVCSLLGEDGECPTTDDDDCKEKYKWCYEDEALALIGEEGDTNG